MTITDREFNSIREIVYDRFGITLSEAKKSLVVGGLQKDKAPPAKPDA